MRESFHIHADLWGVVTLTPNENQSQFNAVRDQMADHDRTHWNGAGWDKSFLLPDDQYPLVNRAMPYEHFFHHFQPTFYPLPLVMIGDTLPLSVKAVDEFALYCPNFGTLYGLHRKLDGVMTQLHFAEDEDLILSDQSLNLLQTFGEEYHLLLIDWYIRQDVDLSDTEALYAYFSGA
jgi:hypothetical protein